MKLMDKENDYILEIGSNDGIFQTICREEI